jgi:hypothetical protein
LQVFALAAAILAQGGVGVYWLVRDREPAPAGQRALAAEPATQGKRVPTVSVKEGLVGTRSGAKT